MSTKKEWDALFDSMSQEDLFSSKADVLAMQFLGLVDQKWSKITSAKKTLPKKSGLRHPSSLSCLEEIGNPIGLYWPRCLWNLG